GGRAGLAAVDDLSEHTAGSARGAAGPDAAAGAEGHVVFIGHAVAIVVESVAGRVRAGGDAGLAAVDDLSEHTAGNARGAAGADAAAGAEGRVVFVGHAIAVVVDAVAARVGAGRRTRLAAVDDLSEHTAGGARGAAGADAAAGAE